MPLCRGLVPGRPEPSSFGSSRPDHATRPPSQATASALHRTIQKSTFLSGRQSPRANSPLTPEQILDLTHMLSQHVETPMLTSSIAGLKSPLTRSRRSSPAHCLCHVHTWFDLRWIDELTSVIGAELGPHLDSLRNAPRQLRSVETDEMLGMLQNYAHIFPSHDPDGSRMANPYQCSLRNCAVCNVTSCRACKLSQFFQNRDAVRALNVCVKGRKKRGKPWPEACAWLDPMPGSGWEMKWKKQGLPVLSDRIIVREWRKAGGQERLTAAVTSIQAEVLADRDAVEKQFENATRESAESRRTHGLRAYEDIVERKWTYCEEAMQSSETLNLLKKLGMDDEEEGETQGGEKRAESYETAYHHLMGTNSQLNVRPPSPHEESREHDSRASATASHHTASSNAVRASEASQASYPRERPTDYQTWARNQVGRSTGASTTSLSSAHESSRAPSTAFRDSASRVSRAPSEATVREPPRERNAQSWGASYANLIGPMAQTQSKLALHDVELETLHPAYRGSSTALRSSVAPSSRYSSMIIHSSGTRDSYTSSSTLRNNNERSNSRQASSTRSSRSSRAHSILSNDSWEGSLSRSASNASSTRTSRANSNLSTNPWENATPTSSRPTSTATTSRRSRAHSTMSGPNNQPPSPSLPSRSRARAPTHVADSWAVFENSPLGKGRAVDEAGKREVVRKATRKALVEVDKRVGGKRR